MSSRTFGVPARGDGRAWAAVSRAGRSNRLIYVKSTFCGTAHSANRSAAESRVAAASGIPQGEYVPAQDLRMAHCLAFAGKNGRIAVP